MAHLNRNQGIAVFVGVAVIVVLLYGQDIMGLFNINTNNTGGVNITPDGVDITETLVGTGLEARAGDTLTVHYVGRLDGGDVFDSSRDRGTPFVFRLGGGEVIRGWEEGFAGMRVGGKRTLIISPSYGYGASGAGPIPPNSTLIFEVELLEVDRP